MANGTGMDHGTDLQQKSPTSPQQQAVKCETLHQKYFETVAYADTVPKTGSPSNFQDVTQTALTHTPHTSFPPTRVELSAPADSHKSNKRSVPHISRQSSDSNPSTSVDDLNNKISIPPSNKTVIPGAAGNLPSTSKPSCECQSKKPLETSFPVEPLVLVDTGKPATVVKASSIPPPPVDRIKKKGIKTTPLIKTTLRTTAGKPKSPLVARVARPAIAIKTTVSGDTKLLSVSEKSKETGAKSSTVSEKSRETSEKPACVSEKSREACGKSASGCEKSRETNEKSADDSEKSKGTSDKTKAEEKHVTETVNFVNESKVESGKDSPEIIHVSKGDNEVEVVENCELSVITEEIIGPDLKDYIGFSFTSLRDKGNLDESEAASDSIRVNVDTDSINTLTDPIEEEFCTQYSGADSEDNFCDSKETADSDSKEIGDNSLISNDSADCKTDSPLDADDDLEDISEELESDKAVDIISEDNANVKDLKLESRDTRLNRIKVKSASLNRKSHDDPGHPFDQVRPVLKESGSRLSILRNWNDNVRSLYNRNRSFDSENSSYASFYSIDNGNVETSLASKSRKLKWTPRILSETRFSSTTSGTFSDCASFYTADTCGTFYSARSFQLDSCDNFETCEDFQKLDLTPRSKLTKAKEAIQRGKDFVKAKFENYRKRLPALRRSDQGEERQQQQPRFKSLCHQSCGFSCVHLGKEISQYSLPDLSAAKGDNPGVLEGEATELGCDKQDDQDVGLCSAVREDPVTEDMDTNESSRTAGGEETDGSPSSSNHGDDTSPDDSRTVKMETVVRETTEGEDDDMPVGTEAISIPRSHRPSENGESDERPASKRLRWVSAVQKTQGTSVTSSFTSNSRNLAKLHACVDQLLQQREMDPETLLNNLGFGADPNTDESLDRIPERFVTNPCAARGINLQQFLVNHPELHHLLPMLDRSMPSAESGGGHSQMSGSENQPVTPLLKKGSMQRQHTFSGVLHGMRFMREVQTPSPPVPDEEDQRISQLHSVLDFPNRKALARQGFYGREFLNKNDENSEAGATKTSHSLSAAQRRKQFHHSCKSRSKNWSFTEESDNEKENNKEVAKEQADSFDRGLMLRSFSERFSSDSSLESADSYYENSRRQLMKQNSISNLRKQYQETIRQSMDGEFPVFDDLNNNETDSGRKLSISEVRKKQVDRLMASEEDDGDYVAHTRQSNLKETPVSALRRAQNSTQSTISDSPHSPNDFKFSFESGLHDGESEFGFSSQPKSQAVKSSTISVIVEEPSVKFELPSEEITTSVSNPNELELPSLVLRSDSCNTLVSQDTGESEHLEGELTPRPGDSIPEGTPNEGLLVNKLISGDAWSESTGSTRTLTTGQDNLDGTTPSEESDNEGRSQQGGQRSPEVMKDTLKPVPLCPPQESFELEEISSAEDMNGSNAPKSQGKRGPLEKSASTHSDSSGFADLDTVGETTQSSITDIPKETFTSSSVKPTLTKQRTLRLENQNQSVGNNITDSYHDNTTTADPASFHQTETMERQILMEQQACLMDQVMAPAIEETKALYICGKNFAKSCDNVTDKENENPELQSISYIPDSDTEKSIVYTVNVPLAETYTEDRKNQLQLPRRYVSKVSMKVLTGKDIGDSQSTISDRSDNSRVVQLGAVEHEELGAEDKDKSETDFEPKIIPATEMSIFAEIQKTEADTSKPIMFQPCSGLVSPRQADIPNPNLDVKSEIRSKQKAKEALIAATNQTADWLLSNEKQRCERITSPHARPTAAHYNLGRPIWASTPDLKQQVSDIPIKAKQKFPGLKEANYSHSLDMHPDNEDEHFIQKEEFFRGGNLGGSRSHKKSRPLPHHHSVDSSWDDHSLGSGDLRHASQVSLSDESVCIPRYSMVESSIGMPEDHMHYLKLARLVNGPSLVMNFDTKMPITRYTPNIKMKNWVEVPRNAHLEKETRLMQHAIQRYKVELSVMETMLTTMYTQAQSDMGHEERAEVEELQQLWSGVRKEVDKMELLLTDRLKALGAGNDSYSPLDALQIIQAMIDLLREQLYHQQMCITKDYRLHSDEPEDLISSMSTNGTSPRSMSTSSAFLSDLSQQVSEVKEEVSRSQEMQKQALQETFSELKSSLLAEVKGEMSATTNAKMLQLQLQARDNEIQRLRMELLLQSVESGKTRKRTTLESDV